MVPAPHQHDASPRSCHGLDMHGNPGHRVLQVMSPQQAPAKQATFHPLTSAASPGPSHPPAPMPRLQQPTQIASCCAPDPAPAASRYPPQHCRPAGAWSHIWAVRQLMWNNALRRLTCCRPSCHQGMGHGFGGTQLFCTAQILSILSDTYISIPWIAPIDTSVAIVCRDPLQASQDIVMSSCGHRITSQPAGAPRWRSACRGMPGRRVLGGSHEGGLSPVPHPQTPPGCPHCPVPLLQQNRPATGLQRHKSQACPMLERQLTTGCLVCRLSCEHAMMTKAAACLDLALGLLCWTVSWH